MGSSVEGNLNVVKEWLTSQQGPKGGDASKKMRLGINKSGELFFDNKSFFDAKKNFFKKSEYKTDLKTVLSQVIKVVGDNIEDVTDEELQKLLVKIDQCSNRSSIFKYRYANKFKAEVKELINSKMKDVFAKPKLVKSDNRPPITISVTKTPSTESITTVVNRNIKSSVSAEKVLGNLKFEGLNETQMKDLVSKMISECSNERDSNELGSVFSKLISRAIENDHDTEVKKFLNCAITVLEEHFTGAELIANFIEAKSIPKQDLDIFNSLPNSIKAAISIGIYDKTDKYPEYFSRSDNLYEDVKELYLIFGGSLTAVSSSAIDKAIPDFNGRLEQEGELFNLKDSFDEKHSAGIEGVSESFFEGQSSIVNSSMFDLTKELVRNVDWNVTIGTNELGKLQEEASEHARTRIRNLLVASYDMLGVSVDAEEIDKTAEALAVVQNKDIEWMQPFTSLGEQSDDFQKKKALIPLKFLSQHVNAYATTILSQQINMFGAKNNLCFVPVAKDPTDKNTIMSKGENNKILITTEMDIPFFVNSDQIMDIGPEGLPEMVRMARIKAKLVIAVDSETGDASITVERSNVRFEDNIPQHVKIRFLEAVNGNFHKKSQTKIEEYVQSVVRVYKTPGDEEIAQRMILSKINSKDDFSEKIKHLEELKKQLGEQKVQKFVKELFDSVFKMPDSDNKKKTVCNLVNCLSGAFGMKYAIEVLKDMTGMEQIEVIKLLNELGVELEEDQHIELVENTFQTIFKMKDVDARRKAASKLMSSLGTQFATKIINMALDAEIETCTSDAEKEVLFRRSTISMMLLGALINSRLDKTEILRAEKFRTTLLDLDKISSSVDLGSVISTADIVLSIVNELSKDPDFKKFCIDFYDKVKKVEDSMSKNEKLEKSEIERISMQFVLSSLFLSGISPKIYDIIFSSDDEELRVKKTTDKDRDIMTKAFAKLQRTANKVSIDRSKIWEEIANALFTSDPEVE